MKKRIVSGILLIMILICIWRFAFNIRSVKATGTIYIRADGSIDPPTANITSADNVTYYFTNNIYDSIVVERDNIVVDGIGYTVQGPGILEVGIGIDLSGRTNVTIKNMEIKDFFCAIDACLESHACMANSSSNKIVANNITNNQFGITLRYATNYNIDRNSITNNGGTGITLHYSSNNSFVENSITNNTVGMNIVISSNNDFIGNDVTTNSVLGVHFDWSSNSNLVENVIRGNGYNLGLEGDSLTHYIHSIDTSNLVNDEPVYYLINQTNLTIDPSSYPEVGYLGLVDCNNMTVQGLNLTNNGNGLLLVHTNNSKVSKNNVGNSHWGIDLRWCSDNELAENKVTNTQHSAIYLLEASDNKIFENNIGPTGGYGIRLGSSFNNIVSGNNITGSTISLFWSSYNNLTRNNLRHSLGIWIHNASDNHLVGNEVADGQGIILSDSSNNHLIGNDLINNTPGIELHACFGNRIYHNNFINNTEQVYDSSTNTWDDGYPSGGNYWSNYEERYPNATEIDDSGIWDTPYIIDENNQDNYPLMCARNKPPVISDIERRPITPNYDEGVVVSAIITDCDGVDQAFLSHAQDSAWHNVSMSRFGDTFNATIPAQPYGTVVQYRVYANDTEGNWAVSELHSYTVGDFLPPGTELLHTPNYPLPGQKVKVYANVTEPTNSSGLDPPVFFHYRVNGNPWWNTTMIFDEATGLYEATIPAYEKHDLVEYFVKATDNAGNINTTVMHHYEVLRTDANHNGVVDVHDIHMIAKAWGSNIGEPGYRPEADINEDGTTDAQDLTIVTMQYGKDP